MILAVFFYIKNPQELPYYLSQRMMQRGNLHFCTLIYYTQLHIYIYSLYQIRKKRKLLNSRLGVPGRFEISRQRSRIKKEKNNRATVYM